MRPTRNSRFDSSKRLRFLSQGTKRIAEDPRVSPNLNRRSKRTFASRLLGIEQRQMRLITKAFLKTFLSFLSIVRTRNSSANSYITNEDKKRKENVRRDDFRTTFDCSNGNNLRAIDSLPPFSLPPPSLSLFLFCFPFFVFLVSTIFIGLEYRSLARSIEH